MFGTAERVLIRRCARVCCSGVSNLVAHVVDAAFDDCSVTNIVLPHRLLEVRAAVQGGRAVVEGTCCVWQNVAHNACAVVQPVGSLRLLQLPRLLLSAVFRATVNDAALPLSPCGLDRRDKSFLARVSYHRHGHVFCI